MIDVAVETRRQLDRAGAQIARLLVFLKGLRDIAAGEAQGFAQHHRVLDQVTLAGKVAFDAATFGSVTGRLEIKGWVRREPDGTDRRRKLLWITPRGQQAAAQMRRAVSKVQSRIVAPLDLEERELLLLLLEKLVSGHRDG